MQPQQIPETYRRDQASPFLVRVYQEDFANLNPMELPWKEIRRSPATFPQWHVAKVSSVRTVVGLDWPTNGTGNAIRVYLKREVLRGRLKQFLARFRASKEWREFELAQEFKRCGITVPQPVYYSEARLEDGVPVVFFGTLALPPTWQPAKTFFKEQRTFGEEWIALARFTRRLHAKRILHGDYRSDHIYIDEKVLETGDEMAAFGLIDLDGSRVGKPLTPHERHRALSQLTESLLTSGLEWTNLAEFLRIYDPKRQYGLRAEQIYGKVLIKLRRKKRQSGSLF